MASDHLTNILVMIVSSDPQVRQQGLSTLEDILDRGPWEVAEMKLLVEQLVHMACTEDNATRLGSILYDLDLAFRAPMHVGNLPPGFAVSLGPLVALIDRQALPPQLIAYCLNILSNSGCPEYGSVLARFATNHDPTVRDTATVALVDRAWSHLGLGDLDAARAVATQAVLRAEEPETQRFARMVALVIHASSAIQSGRWNDAAQALDEGLILVHSGPRAAPNTGGRLLHLYGQVNGGTGEPVQARHCLEAALAFFEQVYARESVEQVKNAIANLSPS